MNRRLLAVIAVLIAVGLFGAPLVSPVPDYGPHLKVTVSDEPATFSTAEEKEKKLRNKTTMDYQNLSAPAQHLFDTADKSQNTETTVRMDEAPESLATLVPEDTSSNIVYVHKDGHYYDTYLYRFTPKPSLQAFLLRVGSLLGAIGLGTLAGYFVLTAED